MISVICHIFPGEAEQKGRSGWSMGTREAGHKADTAAHPGLRPSLHEQTLCGVRKSVAKEFPSELGGGPTPFTGYSDRWE